MLSRALVTILLSSSIFLGCADPDEPAVSVEAAVTTEASGITVKATWRPVVTGTPTYGFDATEPFAPIEVAVEDAVVARGHAGFDGLERPFALVPRSEGSSVRWDRVELRYRGESRTGYFGERTISVYEASGIRLSDTDLGAALGAGIAVGIDTNVGPIWAQNSTENHPLQREP